MAVGRTFRKTLQAISKPVEYLDDLSFDPIAAQRLGEAARRIQKKEGARVDPGRLTEFAVGMKTAKGFDPEQAGNVFERTYNDLRSAVEEGIEGGRVRDDKGRVVKDYNQNYVHKIAYETTLEALGRNTGQADFDIIVKSAKNQIRKANDEVSRSGKFDFNNYADRLDKTYFKSSWDIEDVDLNRAKYSDRLVADETFSRERGFGGSRPTGTHETIKYDETTPEGMEHLSKLQSEAEKEWFGIRRDYLEHRKKYGGKMFGESKLGSLAVRMMSGVMTFDGLMNRISPQLGLKFRDIPLITKSVYDKYGNPMHNLGEFDKIRHADGGFDANERRLVKIANSQRDRGLMYDLYSKRFGDEGRKAVQEFFDSYDNLVNHARNSGEKVGHIRGYLKNTFVDSSEARRIFHRIKKNDQDGTLLRKVEEELNESGFYLNNHIGASKNGWQKIGPESEEVKNAFLRQRMDMIKHKSGEGSFASSRDVVSDYSTEYDELVDLMAMPSFAGLTYAKDLSHRIGVRQGLREGFGIEVQNAKSKQELQGHLAAVIGRYTPVGTDVNKIVSGAGADFLVAHTKSNAYGVPQLVENSVRSVLLSNISTLAQQLQDPSITMAKFGPKRTAAATKVIVESMRKSGIVSDKQSKQLLEHINESMREMIDLDVSTPTLKAGIRRSIGNASNKLLYPMKKINEFTSGVHIVAAMKRLTDAVESNDAVYLNRIKSMVGQDTYDEVVKYARGDIDLTPKVSKYFQAELDQMQPSSELGRANWALRAKGTALSMPFSLKGWAIKRMDTFSQDTIEKIVRGATTGNMDEVADGVKTLAIYTAYIGGAGIAFDTAKDTILGTPDEKRRSPVESAAGSMTGLGARFTEGFVEGPGEFMEIATPPSISVLDRIYDDSLRVIRKMYDEDYRPRSMPGRSIIRTIPYTKDVYDLTTNRLGDE